MLKFKLIFAQLIIWRRMKWCTKENSLNMALVNILCETAQMFVNLKHIFTLALNPLHMLFTRQNLQMFLVLA